MAASPLCDFTVRSTFGDYSVRFSEDLAAPLAEILRPGDVFVGDRSVLDLHKAKLTDVFDVCGEHLVLPVEATERQKSYMEVASVIEQLLRGGFRRGNRLVAVGGGIVQDITAFVSSILYRGVDWLFVPTTLLAQGDSCIGSKTSINFGPFKNQLGGFYPPRMVIIDADFLTTLPRKEILSGLGEMAHYFPIAGEEAFQTYADRLPGAMHDGSNLIELIRDSLEIKRGYVEIDEFDKKERQIFNYGHSFGHALESVTGYAVPHGIAVSYGMDLANLVSVRLGLLDPAVRMAIRRPLQAIWREAPLPEIDLRGFEEALRRDKKNRGEDLGLILTRGWGRMFMDYLPLDSDFSRWIADFFAAVRA